MTKNDIYLVAQAKKMYFFQKMFPQKMHACSDV